MSKLYLRTKKLSEERHENPFQPGSFIASNHKLKLTETLGQNATNEKSPQASCYSFHPKG